MGLDQDMLDALRTARVYDLSVEFFAGMPHALTEPPFVFSLLRSHKGTPGAERDSSAACFFGMGGHTGTHIDAISHRAENSGVFEETPVIIRRGILLDIPLVKGVDVLGTADAISGDDLETAERLENVKIVEDDVVLIRTGWMHWWTKDAGRYNASDDDKMPGVATAAGKWLTDKRVSFTGSDTSSYTKAEESPKQALNSPLNKIDIRIMENMYLDQIARDRIYEFIFIATPLKIRGGPASPIRPIAVVCQ